MRNVVAAGEAVTTHHENGTGAVTKVGERAYLGLTWPWYPTLAAGATVVALFAGYGSPWSALWRPLIVAVLVMLTAQLVLTVLTRDRHVPAIVTFLVGLVLLDFEQLGLALAFVVVATVVYGVVRSRRFVPPLADITRLGNIVAVVGFMLVAGNAAFADHYWVPARGTLSTPAPEAPDIWLILADGHPRLDTLRSEFGVDTGPFEQAMAERGFVESPLAHANYNLTFLALASMFNGAQIDQLVPRPPETDTFGILSRLINDGRLLGGFRDAGYEVVSIPTAFTRAAFEHADRYLDSGNLTDFEIGLLGLGKLPQILPDLQRDWMMDDHRQRVLSTFDRLDDLAKERVEHPRIVFAHFLAPHAPVAFGRDGTATAGLACLPVHCSLWDSGEGESGRLDKQAAQVAYIDDRIVATVRTIQDHAARPPVIVVFSDHGHRHDIDDPVESLRSLLLVSTPGRLGLFPATASPVNLITRLSNAYLGTSVALASEESYFLDVARLDEIGAFAYRRLDVP